jgi:hypothetical protein
MRGLPILEPSKSMLGGFLKLAIVIEDDEAFDAEALD